MRSSSGGSTRRHGTRTKYVHDKCRCEPCRQANCRYQSELDRAKSMYRIRCCGGGATWQVERRLRPGGWRGRVIERFRSRKEAEALRSKLNRLDLAEPRWADGGRIRAAQQHLAALREKGVGRNRVATLLGLSRTTIDDVLAGGRRRHARRDRPQRRRILATTVEKILSVGTDAGVAPGVLIEAAETWRLVAELRAMGIRKYQIARALGQKGQGLQLGKVKITKRSADAVARIHAAVIARRMAA